MMVIISTGSILFDFILIVAAATVAIIVYFHHSYQYWSKKGVPYLKPKFPYGNMPFLFQRSLTFAGESKGWYDELKARGQKFGGVWAFSRKVLVLVDPEYIKHILSQDFHHFTDRDFYCNEKKDPVGTHLFNIREPAWKPLRQKFTPTFTSGKMKIMFDSVLKCSNFMIDYLEKCTKMGDDIEIREVLASFTTDVIGSVAFGLECNSFENTHADFRQQGKEIFRPTWSIIIKTLFTKNYPDLCRLIGIKSGKRHCNAFFTNMVRQTLEYRQKHNISRADFLQILINMNNEAKSGKKPFPFEQIVANVILFFVAGFDTSSTVMTFVTYELARNPDIQMKVREEINEVLLKHNGKITYESVKEMTYLQRVLDETMRLYPPLLSLSRICTKEYKLKDTSITIEKGTPVVISPLGMGRDPEYFPDPERFDPSRFSPDEKSKRHPYIHIPFGGGPRNCIGLRFGIMQSKIGLIRILANFKLKISPKTKMPLTIDPTGFLLKEKVTLYLKAEKI